jgi:serine/threonine protein kinase/tetratricopeptide (TPR) repeat protein
VELEGLLQGTLAPAVGGPLEEHLAQCPACRGKLNALAGGDESWLKAKKTTPAHPADSPPLREAMNRLKGDEPLLPPEKAGDRIGRYKLLQQIGEGGCGVVYMAEQEEPVRRRVALKIIKLGMDTKSVIARFEAERQALAMMDHPNIAKVFDAGVTGAGGAESEISNLKSQIHGGRPYFVMELVRGMKITDYCDDAKLSTRARLDLFVQVCHAIQHAHQKGIIHRDIKPSNVLVTVNDGVAVPKVIDFGIAKATSGQQLTDKTLFTAFEQFIGTPAYMSPEQAMLTSLDIDTRSDIYALGVLLYELLTGETPFDARELLAAGVDEMRRTIREKEPDRPSTRLSTLPGNELSTTAQRRGNNAPNLIMELRGDIDWIVMKCLEKDRARRYETANGLAADILRHLNDEPVVACPPSRLYRLQKAVQRNKRAVAAAAAVVASLAIGLTLSTVLFFRERAAHSHADDQASITKTMNEFLLRDVLGQASSELQAEKGFAPDPDLTVRQALERAAGVIGDRFKDQPLQEAVIRQEIGNAFRSMKQSVRGVPHLERALDLYQRTLGPKDPQTLTVKGSLALAYQGAGQLDRAVRLFEETLGVMRATLGADDRRTWAVMANMASAYQAVGRLDEAIALSEEVLKWRRVTLGPNERTTLGSMNNLGSLYRTAGNLDQAIPLLEKTLGLMRTNLLAGDPWTQNAMANLAIAYREADRFDDALPLLKETLELRRTSLGPAHGQTLGAVDALVSAYQDAEKVDEAINLLTEKVNVMRSRPGPPSLKTQDAMHQLAKCYRDAGRLEDARNLFEETLKFRNAALGSDHLATLEEIHSLAEIFSMEKNYAEAERLYRNALREIRPASTNEAPREVPLLGNLLHHLANNLRLQHKLSEARLLAEEALTLYERHSDWAGHELQHASEILEDILKEQGDSRGLEEAHRRYLKVLRAAADAGDGTALNNLAWILATSGNDTIRDGPSAVRYAERAVANSRRKDPQPLDTLAAAYAATGDFARAAGTQREAIGLCRDEGRKTDFATRLKLYEANKPCREP